jgi:hypothetical protein
MIEKNKHILKEVEEEIESALKDPKGLVAHQRRLAFSLSLGTVALIENCLNKSGVLRTGTKINHLWLKKKKENVKELISRQITCPIENIRDIDKILDMALELEKERNEIAYGKPVSEKLLKEKVNLFFELKKLIWENES